MSLSSFALTKSWESAEDFPTFEENEAKVREDMQCLFTELEVGLQTLIAELQRYDTSDGSAGAKSVGIDSIAGITGATNVQDALAILQNTLENITIGQLGDNSVATAMLQSLCITTAKLAALCVTNEKLAAGSVTGDKCDFSDGLPVAGDLEVEGDSSLGGKIFLDSDSYGDELPATAEAGRLFFLKAT